MPRPVCKFFLKGNCKFGSSCRFLHSDNRGGHRQNDDYYDEYSPQDTYDDRNNYRDYDHYESDTSNYHSRRNYNTRNNHNRRNDYNQYEENHDYTDNYNRNNHSSQKGHNVKNYYTEYDNRYENSEDNNKNSNYNYEAKHNHRSENNSELSNFSFGKPKVHFQNENHGNKEKERLLQHYDKPIKCYQKHVNHLLQSDMWPFTCFHPIVSAFPIQPVGCLNLMEVSSEELRCDYYNIKNICADAETVHRRTVDELLMKARRQKEEIVSLTSDSAQSDMLATFARYEESKHPGYHNIIQMDPNSYWDISLQSIKNYGTNNASELESFSFVNKKEKPPAQGGTPALKILMQVETYGKVDCDAFDQQDFTDYIPIMPPPRKYCV